MIIPQLNLERQADALVKAQKHWQDALEHPEIVPRKKTAFAVAVTREAGAAGAAVAREVGRRLNWTVYDRELVERIAGEMGLRSNLLEAVDEKRKSWLMECVESLTAARTVSEARFVKQLVETVLSLGAIGNCVIVGRGAAQILPAASTLRVRLVADKEHRIANAQEQMKLTREKAATWVDETDRERANFIKEHFGKDPSDPTLYDLVLNSSRWSVEDCAELIVDALKKLQAK